MNARVYTVDAAQPRAEAFAVKNGRFVAVGLVERRPEPGDGPNTRHRRRRPDRDAGVHRHALPRERRRRALQRQRQRAPRARAAGKPQGQGRQDPGRSVGRGHHVRRHQARRRPDQALPRRGDARSSAGREPSRRTHQLVQLEGLRAGRHHEGHAGSGPRPFLPRRERRAHRPRRGAGAQRLQQGRHARDLHARAAARARPERDALHLGAADRRRAHLGPRRRRRPGSDSRLRGRQGQRRAPPPRGVPGPRHRDVRRLQGRGRLLRLRRRVAARHRRQVRGRRVGLRADDAHEHAVCRAPATTASSR